MMPSRWRPALCFTLFSNIGCTPDGSESNRCRCSAALCLDHGGSTHELGYETSGTIRLSNCGLQ